MVQVSDLEDVLGNAICIAIIPKNVKNIVFIMSDDPLVASQYISLIELMFDKIRNSKNDQNKFKHSTDFLKNVHVLFL